jgi:hypothetical protein
MAHLKVGINTTGQYGVVNEVAFGASEPFRLEWRIKATSVDGTILFGNKGNSAGALSMDSGDNAKIILNSTNFNISGLSFTYNNLNDNIFILERYANDDTELFINGESASLVNFPDAFDFNFFFLRDSTNSNRASFEFYYLKIDIDGTPVHNFDTSVATTLDNHITDTISANNVQLVGFSADGSHWDGATVEAHRAGTGDGTAALALTTSGVVDLASNINFLAETTWTISARVRKLGNNNNAISILGRRGSYGAGIRIGKDFLSIVMGNNQHVTFVTPVDLDSGSLLDFTVVRTATNEHTLNLRGFAPVVSTTDASGFANSYFDSMAWFGDGRKEDYDLHYLTIDTPTQNIAFLANNSGGSGSALPEESGVHDGTLDANFPTDGSQWIGTFNAANNVPTANAGTNVSIIEGNQFQLDGSASADSDGSIASYAWTQTAGTTTALSDTSIVNPTGTRSVTGTGETLTYSLVVTDNEGENSTANTVDVVVAAAEAEEQAPVVITNGNQSNISPAATVTLDGSDSIDEDGTISSYQWSQVSGVTVSLTNANTATATYTAPDLDSVSTLVFQLVITDNDGNTATSQVTHTVNSNAQLDLGTAPLADSISFDYIGSFYGNGLPFGGGNICISEDGNSFFTEQGSSFKQYLLPNNLNLETGYPNAKEATFIQESGAIFDTARIALGITERFRVTGMSHKGGKLIVNYVDWYDNSYTPQTTFVFRDTTDLANSAIDGPFGMVDEARQAGVIVNIPPNLQEFFGGDLLSSTPNESIDGRFDFGPSARAINSSEFIEESRTAENYVQLTGEAYIRHNGNTVDGEWTGFYDREDYADAIDSNSTALRNSAYNNIPVEKNDGTFTDSNYWNGNSKLISTFVIPGTKTLCVVAAMSGSTAEPYYTNAAVLPSNVPSGIGYKIKNWYYDESTNEYKQRTQDSAGGTRWIEDDTYHRFYLFDLSDLKEVKDGTRNPWEVQPYSVQDFKSPLTTARGDVAIPLHFLPARGHFDTNTNLLYLAYGAQGGTGEYDQSPNFSVFNINNLGDYSRITNGSYTPPTNTVPTLTITTDKTTYEAGETITFTATGSDADSDALTYLWSSGETSQAITVTAPTGSSSSTVTRSCVVNDGTIDSSSSSETVNVNAEVVEPDPTISVTVTGSLTVLFGGVLPTFAATSSDGETVTTVNNAVNNIAGTYVVTFNAPSAVEVTRTITVEEEVAVVPVVTIGGVTSAVKAASATLTSTITDEDSELTYTYVWRVISGGAVASGSTEESTFTFTAGTELGGIMTIGLIVNDGTDNSLEALFAISITEDFSINTSWANTVNKSRIWFN